MKITTLTFLFLIFIIIQTSAQLNLPNASPDGELKQEVGFTDVAVKYSRPGAKGRTIFGGLVPFGELWRTGAHDATTIRVSDTVKLNGHLVPAGTYSFFTIPNPKEWTIILNKDTAMHGTSEYKQENDLIRFTATAENSSRFYETFTIEINDIIKDAASLYLIWENTQVKLAITTNADEVVIAEINNRINVKKEDRASLLYQSALYYFNNGKDLKQAYEWIQVANKKGQDAVHLQLRAKIEAALGKYDAAIKSARTSSDLATTKKLDQVVSSNEKLIKEWSSKLEIK